MESAGINHLHRTLLYGLISLKEGHHLKSQKESWETVEPKYDFGGFSHDLMLTLLPIYR